MISYTIKPQENEGEEAVIVKTGQTHEFKMSEVKAHLDKIEKAKKELSAQIELEAAKMANVEEHHPFVKEFEGERLAAVAIYAETKTRHKVCSEKLEQIEKVEAETLADLEEVKTQTGLAL